MTPDAIARAIRLIDDAAHTSTGDQVDLARVIALLDDCDGRGPFRTVWLRCAGFVEMTPERMDEPATVTLTPKARSVLAERAT
jgi:hypothetical protein